jgi:hypothetical protein
MPVPTRGNAFDSHTSPLADLLLGRMVAIGIDAEAVAQLKPITFRKIRTLCSTCNWHTLCQWDLKYSATSAASQKYCPNSAMLDDLRAIPQFWNEPRHF